MRLFWPNKRQRHSKTVGQITLSYSAALGGEFRTTRESRRLISSASPCGYAELWHDLAVPQFRRSKTRPCVPQQR